MLHDMQIHDWLLTERTHIWFWEESKFQFLCSTKSGDRTEIFTISKQRASFKHCIGLVFLILEGNIPIRCPRVIPCDCSALPGSGNQALCDTPAAAQVSCEAKHLPRVASPSKNLLSSSFFVIRWQIAQIALKNFQGTFSLYSYCKALSVQITLQIRNFLFL